MFADLEKNPMATQLNGTDRNSSTESFSVNHGIFQT